ncbi:MAG: AsnC family transcriptional regulator [Deltaproteobacteria bacterium]|nr:AsnC family transcriptional regulator [Deltaproteobacteria bacterium]
MDDSDKLIINHIQSDFPITKRPYIAIAEKIGSSEQEVIERILRLKKNGIIRRIGGNFVPGKLGFVSTLCAARVSKDKIEIFVKKVNIFNGVTHNYKRDHKYNIWFTFIAPDTDEIKANLEEIKKETGVTEILNLPASRVFKIKAEFNV